jgi:HYDIN/CFA65/VesB family protein
MKRLFWLSIVLLFASTAHAQCSGSGVSFTCTATSTSADVAGAIAAASDGAVITFAANPSPGYTWTTWPKSSNTKGLTLICATAPPTTPVSITAWSLVSGVVTFTAANSLVAGQTVVLSGFSTSTFFNNLPITVLAAGLSGSQFAANFKFTRSDSSATEAGIATSTGAAVTNQCLMNAGKNTTFGTDFIDGVNTHFYRVSGFTFDLSGPPISITSWSITGNIATFQATNTLNCGDPDSIVLSGFSTSTFFNNYYSGIRCTGLSSTQFTIAFTHADGSGTEAGVGTPNRKPSYGTIYYDSYNGATKNGTLTSFRIDHNTFQNGGGGAQLTLMGQGGIFHAEGVYDHNLVTGREQVGLAMATSLTPVSVRANPLGTSHAMFLEDNTFNLSSLGNLSALGCTDGWGDISFVLRHNNILDCSPVVHGATHAGGPLSYEFYNNSTFMDSGSVSAGTQDGFWALFRHQGSGLVLLFNNSLMAYAGKTLTPTSLADYRAYSGTPLTLSQVAVSGGNVTYTGTGLAGITHGWYMVRGFTNSANNVPVQILSSTTTTATGPATTQVNETNPGTMAGASEDYSITQCDGTVVPANVTFSDGGVDGNRTPISTYRGYPCWHQPGRDFAGTMVPLYVWNNYWADTGALIPLSIVDSGFTTDYLTNHLQANRDYYNASGNVANSGCPGACTPFTGTSGMGWGVLAQRPTTCTATPEVLDAGRGGVGYFATDVGPQGTLYTCTATNTWTSPYASYVYPHPLVGTTSQPLISLSSSSLTFTSAKNISSLSQTVTLTNTGTANLIITSFAASADYFVSTSPSCNGGCTVAPNGTVIATIIFTPSVIGSDNGILTVLDNASGSPHTVTLNGTGTTPPPQIPTTIINPIGVVISK